MNWTQMKMTSCCHNWRVHMPFYFIFTYCLSLALKGYMLHFFWAIWVACILESGANREALESPVVRPGFSNSDQDKRSHLTKWFFLPPWAPQNASELACLPYWLSSLGSVPHPAVLWRASLVNGLPFQHPCYQISEIRFNDRSTEHLSQKGP